MSCHSNKGGLRLEEKDKKAKWITRHYIFHHRTVPIPPLPTRSLVEERPKQRVREPAMRNTDDLISDDSSEVFEVCLSGRDPQSTRRKSEWRTLPGGSYVLEIYRDSAYLHRSLGSSTIGDKVMSLEDARGPFKVSWTDTRNLDQSVIGVEKDPQDIDLE